MQWFTQWRKQRKERQKEQATCEVERLELEEKRMRAALQRVTDVMFTTYCPIRKECCADDCIHFRKGGIWLCDSFDGRFPSWRIRKPYCKLWNK